MGKQGPIWMAPIGLFWSCKESAFVLSTIEVPNVHTIMRAVTAIKESKRMDQLKKLKRYEWNLSFSNICDGKSMIAYIAYTEKLESRSG
ncbi:hypothetical protein VNO77_20541 [Canavalia gladiata]|uniref:Uncharacterized protein n=1 Tax=Canavalia gladiata TaxID=3824 RepID=A0AAN9LPF0_CANGL